MAISPVEIRHVRLPRRLFGYGRGAVMSLLGEIADSYETVWRERVDLAERVEELEAVVARNTELESLLRSTLVSAERTAQELKEQARREADLIVSEAQAQARAVTRDAATERERLRSETHRARALLAAALETVTEAEAAAAAVADVPALPPVVSEPDETTDEIAARVEAA